MVAGDSYLPRANRNGGNLEKPSPLAAGLLLVLATFTGWQTVIIISAIDYHACFPFHRCKPAICLRSRPCPTFGIQDNCHNHELSRAV